MAVNLFSSSFHSSSGNSVTPYETVFVLVQELHLFCQFHTERAEHIINNFVAVGGKRSRSPGFPSMALTSPSISSSVMNFAKEDFLVPSLAMAIKARAFRAVSFCELHQLVDLLAGHGTLSLGVDAADASACLKGAFKYRESAVLHNFAYIMKLHTETHIRLSDPKRSMASCHVILWIGSFTSTSALL